VDGAGLGNRIDGGQGRCAHSGGRREGGGGWWWGCRVLRGEVGGG